MTSVRTLSDDTTTSGSSLTESLKYDIECPICLIDFDDPKQLNCGHVVCKTCIESALRTNKTVKFQCPECRKVTEIPFDGLPTNYTVKKLVAQLRDRERASSPDNSSTEQCSHCNRRVSSKKKLYICITCSRTTNLNEQTAFCATCRDNVGHNCHAMCISVDTVADDQYRFDAYGRIAAILDACANDTRHAVNTFKEFLEKATLASFHSLGQQVFESLQHPTKQHVDMLSMSATTLARHFHQHCNNVMKMRDVDMQNFLERLGYHAKIQERRQIVQAVVPSTITSNYRNSADDDDIVIISESSTAIASNNLVAVPQPDTTVAAVETPTTTFTTMPQNSPLSLCVASTSRTPTTSTATSKQSLPTDNLRQMPGTSLSTIETTARSLGYDPQIVTSRSPFFTPAFNGFMPTTSQLSAGHSFGAPSTDIIWPSDLMDVFDKVYDWTNMYGAPIETLTSRKRRSYTKKEPKAPTMNKSDELPTSSEQGSSTSLNDIDKDARPPIKLRLKRPRGPNTSTSILSNSVAAPAAGSQSIPPHRFNIESGYRQQLLPYPMFELSTPCQQPTQPVKIEQQAFQPTQALPFVGPSTSYNYAQNYLPMATFSNGALHQVQRHDLMCPVRMSANNQCQCASSSLN